MASNKERLSDLETGLGLVQDEVAKLTEVMAMNRPGRSGTRWHSGRVFRISVLFYNTS
ncbi:hypothetical protein YC2023_075004 [Brassica napus]